MYKEMVIASGSDINNVSLRHSPRHFPEGNLVIFTHLRPQRQFFTEYFFCLILRRSQMTKQQQSRQHAESKKRYYRRGRTMCACRILYLYGGELLQYPVTYCPLAFSFSIGDIYVLMPTASPIPRHTFPFSLPGGPQPGGRSVTLFSKSYKSYGVKASCVVRIFSTTTDRSWTRLSGVPKKW